MFEIGELMVYGNKGVCRIEDITHIDMMGADKERLYYVLVPVEDTSGKIYAPVDNTKITMRKVISREAAEELLLKLPKVELLWAADDKMREAKYKEAMSSCDYYAWVSIVKTLYLRKKERDAQGKKITALDEKYMKAAENGLYSELSLTLGISKDKTEDYIKAQLNDMESEGSLL